MKADEVREKVIDYLKENGSANMTELWREIGCGKQTIYDVVRELEEEGKVKSSIVRGRRVVTLIGIIPNYLKTLIVVTFSTLILFGVETKANPIIVNTSGGWDYTSSIVAYPPISTVLLSLLTGFWIAVFMLRYDDVYESYLTIKKQLMKLIDQIDLSTSYK